jgi:hypothetical protein
MSYVEKNLVPGETLLYQTRHHWIVLIGPLLIALLVGFCSNAGRSVEAAVLEEQRIGVHLQIGEALCDIACETPMCGHMTAIK